MGQDVAADAHGSAVVSSQYGWQEHLLLLQYCLLFDILTDALGQPEPPPVFRQSGIAVVNARPNGALPMMRYRLQYRLKLAFSCLREQQESPTCDWGSSFNDDARTMCLIDSAE
jgi:hypothetical protein